MGLETATYVADLVATNPLGSDGKDQGDDHLRMIKSVLQASLAGFAGGVLWTGAEAQGATVNDYVVTVSPAPAAYTASVVVLFKATHTNAGACTLAVGALASKPLVGVDGAALQSGDLASGALGVAFYDGTSFILVSGNDRAARSGDVYKGTHDFTGGVVDVAEPAAADNSAKAAPTSYVDRADNLKANLAGASYTGTHDFTGATTKAKTAAPGTNDTTVATTAFATQVAFEAALPVQSVPAVLYTDGSAASWRSSFVGDSGTGGQLGPVPAPAAGDATKFLKGDGTWGVDPSAPDVVVQDQKTNTSGGALSGSPAVRTLNTLVRNVGSLASLSSNLVTLGSGTYYFRARSTVTGLLLTNGGGASCRAQIYNNTDGALIAEGENVFMGGTSTGDSCGCLTEVSGVATLSASKAICLRTLAGGVGGVSLSGGQTTGGADIYSTLEIWKVG